MQVIISLIILALFQVSCSTNIEWKMRRPTRAEIEKNTQESFAKIRSKIDAEKVKFPSFILSLENAKSDEYCKKGEYPGSK